jgi:Peptidase propeptide and YPEB domain
MPIRLVPYLAAAIVIGAQVTPLTAVAAAPAESGGATTQSEPQLQLTPSEREAQARLEGAGYTEVRNVKSGPEGISAKAKKDGKEVGVVVDASGKIKER